MPFGIYKTQDNFSHTYIFHNEVQLLFLIYANTLGVMKQIYFFSDNLFLYGLSSTPHQMRGTSGEADGQRREVAPFLTHTSWPVITNNQSLVTGLMEMTLPFQTGNCDSGLEGPSVTQGQGTQQRMASTDFWGCQRGSRCTKGSQSQAGWGSPLLLPMSQQFS